MLVDAILLWIFVSGALGDRYGSTRVSDTDDSVPSHGKCQPITVPTCINMPYNKTIMPNLVGHSSQDEAGLELNLYMSLIKVTCSPDIQFFLCSVFAPVCTILDYPIPPCRSLCLSAKNGCEPVMKNFGYSWPEFLRCEDFPDISHDLCVGENKQVSLNQQPAGADKKHRLLDQFEPPAHGKNFGFVCPEQFKVNTCNDEQRF